MLMCSGYDVYARHLAPSWNVVCSLALMKSKTHLYICTKFHCISKCATFILVKCRLKHKVNKVPSSSIFNFFLDWCFVSLHRVNSPSVCLCKILPFSSRMGKDKTAHWRTQKALSALLSSFFQPSSSISSLCSVSTTASEVTTQLSLAIHLRPWQRLLSLFCPSSLPLSSHQTCNYSVGQHAPHWPTVKYDHQFGPYPFIAIPPPPMGASRCFSPPAPFPPPPTISPPIHLTPSQLPHRKASRWGISPSTIST